MAGVSISHLIIFIASLLIAGAVVGAAFTGVDQFNSAMEDRSITAAEQLRTDISVISDPASHAIYDDDSGNVTVLLKNTGELNLLADPRQIDVLLNGEYVVAERLAVDVLDADGNNWRTSNVIELTLLTEGLDPGDHRITITVNGAEAVLEFRIMEEEGS